LTRGTGRGSNLERSFNPSQTPHKKKKKKTKKKQNKNKNKEINRKATEKPKKTAAAVEGVAGERRLESIDGCVISTLWHVGATRGTWETQ
jgi:hypothetical protein